MENLRIESNEKFIDCYNESDLLMWSFWRDDFLVVVYSNYEYKQKPIAAFKLISK